MAEQRSGRHHIYSPSERSVLAHRLVAGQTTDRGAFKACLEEEAIQDDMVGKGSG
jgi:hypothetical protein